MTRLLAQFTHQMSWAAVDQGGSNTSLDQENASDQFVLQFASSAESSKTVPRYWTAAANLAANNDLPLSGVKIAIDPGHLGGTWAKMEERWFPNRKLDPL